jgi:predicted nucleic acid-binding protein
VLRYVTVVPIDAGRARAAGELLGRTGLSGHRCALDALLASVALAQPRPVVLMTSDTEDLRRLTEEPERRGKDRVRIVRI